MQAVAKVRVQQPQVQWCTVQRHLKRRGKFTGWLHPHKSDLASRCQLGFAEEYAELPVPLLLLAFSLANGYEKPSSAKRHTSSLPVAGVIVGGPEATKIARRQRSG